MSLSGLGTLRSRIGLRDHCSRPTLSYARHLASCGGSNGQHAWQSYLRCRCCYRAEILLGYSRTPMRRWPIQILYPHREFLPAKVRRLINFVVGEFGLSSSFV